jgi:ZIP family zinc transporter
MSFAMRTFFPEGHSQARAEAFTPLLAVGIHSFFDGVIYSVSFAASFQSGVYASLGLIMHEFAEGIIAFAILSRHGFKVREALVWAFIAAAATTPLGALVSGLFVSGLGTGTLIALYAISAGLLIYVATGPMMKPLEETSPLRALGALGAGTAFALVVLALPIHEHGVLGNHDHDHGAVDFRDQQRAGEHLH